MNAWLLRNRLFVTGLALRLVLVGLILPLHHLAISVPILTLGPDVSLGVAGLPAPVDGVADIGLVEWIFFTALVRVADLVGFAPLGLMAGVVALDIANYLLLRHFSGDERRDEVAALYWLSPLGLFVVYWVGTLAILAVTVVLGAFAALRKRDNLAAGVLVGLAILDRPVLILLLPIVLLFVRAQLRLRPGAQRIIAAGAAVIVTGAALALAVGVPSSLLGLSDFEAVLSTRLSDGSGGWLAVLPLALAGLWYLAYRIRLLSIPVLAALLTASLLIAIGLGAPLPALVLVVLPFAVDHAAYAEKPGRWLLLGLEGGLIAWFFFASAGVLLLGNLSVTGQALAPYLDPILFVVLRTLVSILALALAGQALVRGVLRSGDHLASRKTIAIGIAGDSGTGKDTLAESLGKLFSPQTVVSVSGDDYHNWDRNKPMWRALTHLDPRANDLALFARHTADLVDRRWVRSRHYDHATGRMTKPFVLHPGEIVVASGLHALFSPRLCALYDLRIYLDMDESLRRFLKIVRDVGVRGHPRERVLASIERRYEDAVEFVHPQKAAADLIFKLAARLPEQLDAVASGNDLALRLTVEARPGMAFEEVTRALVAISDVHAIATISTSGVTVLTIEGDASPQDIASAAKRIAPGVVSMMVDTPQWEGGLKGAMQLILLDQLEQLRVRRTVNA